MNKTVAEQRTGNKFVVCKQIPCPAKIGQVKLALNEKGEAFVMTDVGIKARLFRARVE